MGGRFEEKRSPSITWSWLHKEQQKFLNHTKKIHMTWRIKTIGFGMSWFIVSYFWITNEIILVLAVLMAFDFVTWVIKAVVIPGLKLTSKRAIIGAITKILVFSLPFMTVLAGKVTGIDSKPLADVLMWIIGLSEFYSIISNIIAIKTQKDVEEHDAIMILLTWLKKVIRQRMEKQMITPKQ